MTPQELDQLIRRMTKLPDKFIDRVLKAAGKELLKRNTKKFKRIFNNRRNP